MREGDLFYSESSDGLFHVGKLLRIDPWEGADGPVAVYHCMGYAPVNRLPDANDVGQLEPLVLHSPIDGGSIERNCRYLTNRPVTLEELEGFHGYLKRTNYPRYLQETGTDLEQVIAEAQVAYRRGVQLHDARQFPEALVAYSEAVELFPLFFEALDNQGFVHMSLGQFADAIHDFEESLRVNPDGKHAMFSIGECWFKLKEFRQAEPIFRECVRRWPQEAAFQRHLTMTQRLLSVNGGEL